MDWTKQAVVQLCVTDSAALVIPLGVSRAREPSARGTFVYLSKPHLVICVVTDCGFNACLSHGTQQFSDFFCVEVVAACVRHRLRTFCGARHTCDKPRIWRITDPHLETVTRKKTQCQNHHQQPHHHPSLPHHPLLPPPHVATFRPKHVFLNSASKIEEEIYTQNMKTKTKNADQKTARKKSKNCKIRKLQLTTRIVNYK